MKDKMLAKLPFKDIQLIERIENLPTLSPIKIWTLPQENFINYLKSEWKIISKYLGYRLLRQLGENPKFTLVGDYDPDALELITLKGDVCFFQLQLITENFEIIKEYSIKERRDFPFSKSRQLFIQILRVIVEDRLKDCLKEEREQGISATELRKGLRKYINFLKKKTSSNDEEKEILNSLKSSVEWCDFWIYPVWDNYYKSSKRTEFLKNAWNGYLSSLEKLNTFIKCSSEKTGILCTIPKWSYGYPYEGKLGKRIDFS